RPFRDIPEHVEQSPVILDLLPNWVRCTARVEAVPRDPLKKRIGPTSTEVRLRFDITIVECRSRTRSARVLPLRLRGQPIALTLVDARTRELLLFAFQTTAQLTGASYESVTGSERWFMTHGQKIRERERLGPTHVPNGTLSFQAIFSIFNLPARIREALRHPLSLSQLVLLYFKGMR